TYEYYPLQNAPAWWQFSWFVWSTPPKLLSNSPCDPVAQQAALLRANVCHSSHPLQLQLQGVGTHGVLHGP
ncbi:hypothetical protein F441_03652, partial [Phytophthora nicotianae CJ01A1]